MPLASALFAILVPAVAQASKLSVPAYRRVELLLSKTYETLWCMI